MSMRQYSYLMVGIKINRAVIYGIYEDDTMYEIREQAYEGKIPVTMLTGENSENYFIGKILFSIDGDSEDDCVEIDANLNVIEEVKEQIKEHFPELATYEVKTMMVSLWS